MITIARCSKPEEAHLLRMRLEASGVSAYVLDENLIQMNWLLSNAIGGVRVQIKEEDVERAKEILQEEPYELLKAERPVCPECASIHTAPDEVPRRLSLIFLWLADFPFLFSKHRWKCLDCGKKWSERKAKKPSAVP